jgi:acid phosphatase family membrane protein YuiD
MFVNKTLVAVLLAALISQGIKILFILKIHKQLHFRDLMVTGGMPSTHAALVTSLTLIVLFLDGVSIAFVLSLVLAIIVLRDAYGVRRAVGEEGLALKKIMKKVKIDSPKIHYAMGHKPIEVLVGMLIGAICAILIYLI